jgi:L-amino acid N-acyltransferase YncA
MGGEMTTRSATRKDAAAIARIYNEGIEDRIATFETRPRTSADIEAWFDGVHPIVVAEEDGDVIAFASTSVYRPRDCYARNAEFSVYVARSHRRDGAGRLVLTALMDAARDSGFHKLLSRVFPENVASLGLLSKLGFREVGRYDKHGELDGRWRDVVIVEKLL